VDPIHAPQITQTCFMRCIRQDLLEDLSDVFRIQPVLVVANVCPVISLSLLSVKARFWSAVSHKPVSFRDLEGNFVACGELKSRRTALRWNKAITASTITSLACSRESSSATLEPTWRMFYEWRSGSTQSLCRKVEERPQKGRRKGLHLFNPEI